MASLLKRSLAEILAVQVEKIEGEENRLSGGPFHVGIEQLDVRTARFVLDDGFAVNDGAPAWKRGGFRYEARIAIAPVMAAA